MPVYRQGYRSYEGRVRRHFRWWVVMEQEWRILAAAKPFRYLTLLGMLHALLRMLQIVAYDTMRDDARGPVALALRSMEELSVNAALFFDFIRLQAPLAFIIMLYAGAGLICNDLRNNLTEVYFAKPLTWRDYLLGKVATLMGAGLLVTAVPAVALVALHNGLVAELAVLRETWWWAPASLAFSCVIVVPAALTILASSALVTSQRFAAIGVFMVLIASSAMGALFAQMLRDARYMLLSIPMAANRLGIELFSVRQWSAHLDWQPCAWLLGGLCVAALTLLVWKVRKAEVGT